MEGEPQAGAGACGAAAGGDARFVDVPFGRLAADSLEGACCVVKGCLDGRDDILRLGDVSVVDGDYGDTGLEVGFHGGARFVTGLPSTAMDVKEKRGGLVRFGFPEVENVSFVRSVF